ncbi:anti-sigma factor antagonist [Actinomadura sp. LD22]|uniref:Anti-sigma factor antagonist n=1 Tax=Actinomadura physcomitrii TaxID=2650748 RepID=A0A6I4MKW4_9ACTN|nr:STAS domain-containing protein [Actinomadura physcomitrii]MWA06472.1 anti-sigma factor antagonist [Actinomadura physcomitrii]
MTEETRPARRPGRRAPEIRCRTGAGQAASRGSAAPGTAPRGAAAPAAAAPDAIGAWTAGPVPGLAVEVAERRPGTAVVAVAGEIDLHTADGLRAALVRAHAAGARRLVLDFAAVPFCDAAGLGALVGAHNEVCASGGEIVLAGVRPAQLRLLRITGLHRLFAVHADVAAALASQDSPTGSR